MRDGVLRARNLVVACGGHAGRRDDSWDSGRGSALGESLPPGKAGAASAGRAVHAPGCAARARGVTAAVSGLRPGGRPGPLSCACGVADSMRAL